VLADAGSIPAASTRHPYKSSTYGCFFCLLAIPLAIPQNATLAACSGLYAGAPLHHSRTPPVCCPPPTGLRLDFSRVLRRLEVAFIVPISRV